jgi:hypothetical protein
MLSFEASQYRLRKGKTMMSEKPMPTRSQPSLWKLVYRILSPNEVRPEEETPPMSFASCQREARLLRDSIWLDYVLLYIKIVNISNLEEEYVLNMLY